MKDCAIGDSGLFLLNINLRHIYIAFFAMMTKILNGYYSYLGALKPFYSQRGALIYQKRYIVAQKVQFS